MKTPLIPLLFCLVLGINNAHCQVLHTENFNVILDSSRVFKGNFTPNFRYRNQKEKFIEIENTADLSIRLKDNAITIASRVEYSILDKEQIISGGFLYLEYLNLKNKSIAFEPFFQMHWQEARGLENKYASGLNFRWRAIEKKSVGVFLGLGSFYEYEKWNYSGVPDNILPINTSPIVLENIRANTYISIKKRFGELFDLDISAYYQPLWTEPTENYRLATSFELTYNFTKYLGLRFLYQNIYDPDPVVPIDKLFNDVNFGITLSF